MTSVTAATAPRTRPASTGGAWLGLCVAARAFGGVCMSMAPLVMVSVIPLLSSKVGEQIERSAQASDIPPELNTVVDLWSEAAQIVRPYARATGFSGVAIGVLLFLAAAALVRGSEIGRRAVRALLVVDALHTVAATAWMIVLATTKLQSWMDRYQEAVAKMLEVAPQAAGRPFTAVHVPGFLNAVPHVMWCLVSLAVSALLFWLAGRPFARAWCAARTASQGAKSPLATGTQPL